MAYFEDFFAKSSLLGFDNNTNSTVGRNELEQFQRQLLKKIDSKLFKNELEREDDYAMNSLEIMAGNRYQLNPIEEANMDLLDDDSITNSNSSPYEQL